MAVAGSFVCCNVVILFVCIVLLCVAVWEIVKAGRVVLVLVSWAVVLGLWIV